MENRAGALISLKSRFAAAVFAGTKTVELRTRRVRLVPGDTLLIYVTTPVAELQGSALVDFVDIDRPATIWRNYGPLTALDRLEFDAYTAGRSTVSAVGLRAAQKFSTPRSLDELRQAMGQFHPPQFMTFLDSAQIDVISKKQRRQRLLAAE